MVSEQNWREGIHPTISYKWLKDFMEAGKGRTRRDTKREAISEEVRQLREENELLKQLVAELSLANLTLKKSLSSSSPSGGGMRAWGGSANGSSRPCAAFARLKERDDATDFVCPGGMKKHGSWATYDWFDQAIAAAGVNDFTWHDLRHTYICLRLMEGADIYQIAKNCRTSVEMIEKYYAAHIKTQLDAAAINIMRQKPKKRKNQPKTQN